MDFPFFEVPWLGGRWLIGLVALLHVLVSHGVVLGGAVLAVAAERRGLRDPVWDMVARRLALLVFFGASTAGALSGVGLWFTLAVVQPTGAALFLRSHPGPFLAEWAIFVVEMALLLAYAPGWERWRERRLLHFRVGLAYVAASGLAMVLVTGALGGMLLPATSPLGGFAQATYLPQLLIRSGLALGIAASWACLAVAWVAELPPRPEQATEPGGSVGTVGFGSGGRPLEDTVGAGPFEKTLAPTPLEEIGRARSEGSVIAPHTQPYLRWCWSWILTSVPLVAAGTFLYLHALPADLASLVPTALGGLQYASWVQWMQILQLLVLLGVGATGAWGALHARSLHPAVAAFPLLVLVVFLVQFERVREFVRKPYLLPRTLYANGILVEEVPKLNREGILPHARWMDLEVSDGDQERGRAVYRLECAACHTLDGVNGLSGRTAGLGPEAIDAFLAHMHEAHPFMPPFVGTASERRALARFLGGSGGPPASRRTP